MNRKRIPMRRCVGCMESKPKKELLRIATSEDGGVRFDPTGKANGRGVYLCRNAACFAKAIKRRAIARGLNVEVTPERADGLLKELEEVFDIEH